MVVVVGGLQRLHQRGSTKGGGIEIWNQRALFEVRIVDMLFLAGDDQFVDMGVQVALEIYSLLRSPRMGGRGGGSK